MSFFQRCLGIGTFVMLLSTIHGHCQSKELQIQQFYANLETKPDSIFILADSLWQHTDSSKYPLFMAELHEIIGTLLFQRGVHDQALLHLLWAKSFWEKTANDKKKAQTLISLGEVYYYIKKTHLAEEAYNEALGIFRKIKSPQGIGSALNHLGHLAEKQGLLIKAIQLQEQALQEFDRIGDSQGKAQALEGLGSIYEDEENYEQAGKYFLQAFSLNEQRGDLYATLSNLNNVGDSYRKMGKLKEAAYYTTRAMQRADSLGADYQKSSALRDLAKVYFELGDYKSAYQYLEQHRKTYTSIYQIESNLQVNMLQALYASSKKDRLIQSLRRNQEVNRLLALTSIFVILLAGTIIYLFVNRQRIKLVKQQNVLQRDLDQREKEQLLNKVELENARLSEQKLLSELEVNKLTEKILNQELNQKSKELTTHTLQIIRKTKVLAELRDKLKGVHGGLPAGAPKKTVKEILSKLEINLVQEKEWSLFQKVFEEVHDGFFQELSKKHGSLSGSEMRLCALIKLNLNPRDIAASLGISEDSLRIARYRLKKRLGLPATEKLSIYLRNFGGEKIQLNHSISDV